MIKNLSDPEIIQAIRDGKKKVFRHVFDSCYQSLCHYAFTILKNMDEAEDAVQSVFVKLWEKKDALDVRVSIRSYLFRAVHNQCINEMEHRMVVNKHQEYEKGNRNNEAYLEESTEELEQRVTAAIEKLPPQCKVVFRMSRYEELPYAQIASRLGISVNTVENQISKALKILRDELRDLMS